jgi:HAD superfamily hydrolase (TIGR01549 family)
MPIEAVIFDLDGTLASFNLDYKTLRAEAKSHLQKRGVPASVLSQHESIFEMLKKAEIYFKNASKSDEVFIEVQKEVLAIAEKFEYEAASSTSLLPGALETLKSLKHMNVKIGLCTISSHKAANYILQRFQIAGYFDAVVTRDMVQYVKPNPEHFETALKMLGVRPESALVVGDSNTDMQSAKELKTIAVGIPTGMATLEQLTHNGANFIITQISDLTCLVEKINKGLEEAKP